MSRNKGKRFERQVAVQIADYFGWKFNDDIGRIPMSGASRLIGREDLYIKPHLREKFPFYVEAKKREGWSLERFFLPTFQKTDPYKWLQEARSKNPPGSGYATLLVFSRNLAPTFILGYREEILCAIKQDQTPAKWLDCGRMVTIWDKENPMLLGLLEDFLLAL